MHRSDLNHSFPYFLYKKQVQCPFAGFNDLLQPLRWRSVECVFHHERDVREEQNHIYVARTSNN